MMNIPFYKTEDDMSRALYQQMKSGSIFILLFFGISLSSCMSNKLVTPSQLQTSNEQTIIETKELISGVFIPPVFFDELYPDYSQGITMAIHIEEESGALTEEQVNEIKALISTARSEGKIQEITVISWANSPSLQNRKLRRPSSQQPEMSKKQLHYSAALNIENVRSVISDQIGNELILVSTYNMEDSPSLIGRLTRTKEARIKRYLSGLDKHKVRSHILIGVSTTDKTPLSHPALVVL
jgi:hypothetical protein